jgi:hypothetical protein
MLMPSFLLLPPPQQHPTIRKYPPQTGKNKYGYKDIEGGSHQKGDQNSNKKALPESWQRDEQGRQKDTVKEYSYHHTERNGIGSEESKKGYDNSHASRNK